MQLVFVFNITNWIQRCINNIYKLLGKTIDNHKQCEQKCDYYVTHFHLFIANGMCEYFVFHMFLFLIFFYALVPLHYIKIFIVYGLYTYNLFACCGFKQNNFITGI